MDTYIISVQSTRNRQYFLYVDTRNLSFKHTKIFLLCLSNQDNSYGFRSQRNPARGLLSVVQASVIKHLLFDRRLKDNTIPIEVLLRPNAEEQITALWNSIADIIWNIGEKQKAIIVLNSEVQHVLHSEGFFQDTVTERLEIFEFNKLEDMQFFLKR